MILLDYLIFLGVGRLLIWLLQSNGLTRRLVAWKAPTLLELPLRSPTWCAELIDCDLCLGFWVYLIALIVSGPQTAIFGLWPGWFEVFVLAAISTFIMHLVVIGWKQKFTTTIIQ